MTEKMTAEQARAFSTRSLTHAQYLALVAAERGCACEAYRDWFTYRRWKAQGYQVRRGEHGVRLTTFVEKVVTDDETGEEKITKRPWKTTVFCRCQVDPIH